MNICLRLCVVDIWTSNNTLLITTIPFKFSLASARDVICLQPTRIINYWAISMAFRARIYPLETYFALAFLKRSINTSSMRNKWAISSTYISRIIPKKTRVTCALLLGGVCHSIIDTRTVNKALKQTRNPDKVGLTVALIKSTTC